MRYQVLTAASMKMIAFWDIAPCSPVVADHISEVRTASIIRAMMMMEAVRKSETSVCYNETTRHNIPEDYHLYTVTWFSH
jgi:hypothetical protein